MKQKYQAYFIAAFACLIGSFISRFDSSNELQSSQIKGTEALEQDFIMLSSINDLDSAFKEAARTMMNIADFGNNGALVNQDDLKKAAQKYNKLSYDERKSMEARLNELKELLDDVDQFESDTDESVGPWRKDLLIMSSEPAVHKIWDRLAREQIELLNQQKDGLYSIKQALDSLLSGVTELTNNINGLDLSQQISQLSTSANLAQKLIDSTIGPMKMLEGLRSSGGILDTSLPETKLEGQFRDVDNVDSVNDLADYLHKSFVQINGACSKTRRSLHNDQRWLGDVDRY